VPLRIEVANYDPAQSQYKTEPAIPKYGIDRDIPAAGKLPAPELKAIS
jgi:hypothetical protein